MFSCPWWLRIGGALHTIPSSSFYATLWSCPSKHIRPSPARLPRYRPVHLSLLQFTLIKLPNHQFPDETSKRLLCPLNTTKATRWKLHRSKASKHDNLMTTCSRFDPIASMSRLNHVLPSFFRHHSVVRAITDLPIPMASLQPPG